MDQLIIIDNINDTLVRLNEHMNRAKDAGVILEFHIALGDRFQTFNTTHDKVVVSLETATTKLYKRK